eukprot:gnl/MRDRNA2_/MRDRNA2_56391_c0_seq2.p1 gnl/MRDRNA2_/MRDRNA2_56391_c0~~gnl/MRDRNA2_/MRDRNA2_56391_c0_seq2.p1  ORF type:complete len:320 (+),score=70.00 gnl/MRDRNA2_/MRDRNA2_56391_c0_seq2:56-1015(+)
MTLCKRHAEYWVVFLLLCLLQDINCKKSSQKLKKVSHLTARKNELPEEWVSLANMWASIARDSIDYDEGIAAAKAGTARAKAQWAVEILSRAKSKWKEDALEEEAKKLNGHVRTVPRIASDSSDTQTEAEKRWLEAERSWNEAAQVLGQLQRNQEETQNTAAAIARAAEAIARGAQARNASAARSAWSEAATCWKAITTDFIEADKVLIDFAKKHQQPSKRSVRPDDDMADMVPIPISGSPALIPSRFTMAAVVPRPQSRSSESMPHVMHFVAQAFRWISISVLAPTGFFVGSAATLILLDSCRDQSMTSVFRTTTRLQ